MGLVINIQDVTKRSPKWITRYSWQEFIMNKVVGLLLSLLLLSGSSAVVAQEGEPEPGAIAATGLPDASSFGEGWILSEAVSPNVIEPHGFTMTPDVFSEGAAGIYLGPEGRRVLVVNLLVNRNEVAIRAAWHDANEMLQAATRSISTDDERDQELETMPPAEGCVESTRVEGQETFFRLPAGATLCAVDDERLLLAVVYGAVGGETGVAASDAIVSQAVTPTATPMP